MTRMREIGLGRLLYGSDGAVPGHGPREYWASFKTLPLTEAELRAIASNVAPYMQGSWRAAARRRSRVHDARTPYQR